MKKIIYIAFAALAIAACTKSEVEYDGNGGELALSPVSYLSTKAAITSNVFPESNHIALFAYHNPGQVATENVTDYSVFAANQYLNNTEFYYNTTSPTDKVGTKAWSGLNSIYYWPITGSLVFAGYSLPTPAEGQVASPSIGTASYDLMSDVLEIDGYTQSASTASTFDLLYFGRDGKSYNNRRTGTAVPVTFNHALSWITINVKGGAGALVPGHVWKIESLTLKSVNTQGDFIFNGTPEGDEKTITWDLAAATAPMTVFNEDGYEEGKTGQELTAEYVTIENVDDGTVVIPQTPKQLTVVISYKSPANDDIEETFDVDLTLADNATWEAGKHYVYNIEFSPTEIKVAPEVTVWPAEGEEGYVETEIQK